MAAVSYHPLIVRPKYGEQISNVKPLTAVCPVRVRWSNPDVKVCVVRFPPSIEILTYEGFMTFCSVTGTDSK